MLSYNFDIEDDEQQAIAHYFELHRIAAVKLTRPEIGRTIIEALRRLNGQQYLLFDYTILPDHVRFIIKSLDSPQGRPWPLRTLLQSVAAYSAKRINELLEREGQFWSSTVKHTALRYDREYQERAREMWELPKLWKLVADPERWPWWGNGKDQWG